jgi:hypothetical protein
MENQETAEQKVIFINKKPRNQFKQFPNLEISFGIDFDNLENSDPYEHVGQLPDGTIIKVDPNVELTWKQLQKQLYNN